MSKKEQFLIKIKSSIKQEEPSAEIILFGSRARGDNKQSSDWDILILIDKEDKNAEIEDRFRTKLYDLELETDQLISMFVYSKEYWKTKLKYSPLYINVTKEGRQL